MIILYTTHCPRCKVLETKLNQKELTYTIIDDVDEMTGAGIMSVPVLEIDGNKMDFTTANNWLNKLEVQS